MPLTNSAKFFLGTTLTAATIGFSQPTIAAPSADFIGGKTSVTLSNDFVGALTTLKVTLAAPAAAALNGVFKVTAFKAGLNIGTAKVTGLAK